MQTVYNHRITTMDMPVIKFTWKTVYAYDKYGSSLASMYNVVCIGMHTHHYLKLWQEYQIGGFTGG